MISLILPIAAIGAGSILLAICAYLAEHHQREAHVPPERDSLYPDWRLHAVATSTHFRRRKP